MLFLALVTFAFSIWFACYKSKVISVSSELWMYTLGVITLGLAFGLFIAYPKLILLMPTAAAYISASVAFMLTAADIGRRNQKGSN